MRSPDAVNDCGKGPPRRALLRLGALGGATLLAGCTSDIGEEFPPNKRWPTSELTPDLPVRTRTDLLAARVTETAGQEIDDLQSFTSGIEERAIELDSVQTVRDVLAIEIISTRFYEEGHLHAIATVAGAYASLIDHGYAAVALTIVMLDAAPEAFGVATIETDWATRYNAGDLSAKEYGQLVAATIETNRHPPEIGVVPDD